MSKARNDVREWKRSKKLLLASLLAAWGAVGTAEAAQTDVQNAMSSASTDTTTTPINITVTDSAASEATTFSSTNYTYLLIVDSNQTITISGSSGSGSATLSKTDDYSSSSEYLLAIGNRTSSVNQSVNLSDVVFSNNLHSSSNKKGIAAIFGLKNLTVTNGGFENMYLEHAGSLYTGGLWVYGFDTTAGSVSFSDVNIRNNTAIATDGTFVTGGGLRNDNTVTTILSGGEISDNSISLTTSTTSNAEASGGGAVFFSNLSAAATLSIDGTEISGNEATAAYNGHSGDSTKGSTRGGGIIIYTDAAGTGNYDTVDIKDVDIVNNSVTTTSSDGGSLGGGVALIGDVGVVTIKDGSVVSGNTAKAVNGAASGGGIIVANFNGTAAKAVSLTIADTTIQDNIAKTTGAGMASGGGLAINSLNDSVQVITVSLGDDVAFNSNEAKAEGTGGASGGAILSNTGLGTVASSFTGNKATSAGGFANGGAVTISNYTADGTSTIKNNVLTSEFTGNFVDNKASGAGTAQGGALLFYDANSKNSVLTISGNFTNNQASSTGGVAEGGAIWADTSGAAGAVNVNGSTFSGNSASGTNAYGGAIYFGSDNGVINGSTFTNNSVTGGTSSGGGAVYAAGNLTINNSTAGTTFSGNTVNGEANGLQVVGTLTLKGTPKTTIEDGLKAAKVDIDTGATLNMNLAADGELSTVLEGAGKLEKSGTKTLTLTGASGSFSGTTDVNAGTLLVGDSNSTGAASTLGGTTTVNSGATIGGQGVVSNTELKSGAIISPGNGDDDVATLTLNGNLNLTGVTLNIDAPTAGNLGGSDKIVTDGTVTSTGTTTVNLTSLATGDNNKFKIFESTGGLDDVDITGATVTYKGTTNEQRLTATITSENSGKELYITTSFGGSTTITWTGDDTNNIWNNSGSTLNWNEDSTNTRIGFVDGDTVKFTATGSKTPDIAVDSHGVVVDGMTVSADGYTFAGGKISDTTGQLVLDGTNATTIFKNEIDFGNGIDVGASNTLAFDYNANIANGNDIAGAGKVVKKGDGVLTLSGNNTFSGGASIEEGAIAMANANALGTTKVTIGANGELRAAYVTNSGSAFTKDFEGSGAFVAQENTYLNSDRTNFTGAYQVEAGKTLTFDYNDANFDNELKGTGTVAIAKDMTRPGQTAFDGKISVLNTGSLGLTLNTAAPALTVGAIDFNASGKLKVNGGTVLPSPSIYSGADSEGYDLIVSGTTVTLPNYTLDATIAGNPDYLTPELRVDSTGKKIQAFAQLSWFAADPAKQHGTFTIEPGKTFEVAVPLTDQTAVAGWNGKDLTKLGGGTLVLSAQNTATGVFDQKAGGVRFKDGASWAGDYVQAAGSSFTANGNAGIGGDASFAGTVTLGNRSSLNAGGDFTMANTGSLNLTPTSNITADTRTFAPETSMNVDFSGVPLDGQTRDYANILVARSGGLDTDLLSSLFAYSSVLTNQSAYFDGGSMGLRYTFSTLQDKVNELPGMRDNIGVASAGLDNAFAQGALGDLQRYLYSIQGTDEFYAAMSSLASVEVAANMLAMGLAHHPERTTFNRFIGSAMQSVSQTGVSTDDAYGSLSSCGYGLREARNRIWAEGVLSRGSVSGDGRSSGYDTRRNGLRLGYDFLATDNLILGGMFGYTDPRLKASSTKIEADDFTFALYGYSRLAEHFHASGFVGYGHERYDMTRRGPLGGHRAKYSGNSFYSALEFSAPFAIACSGLTIAPLAGVDFVKSWTNGYAESGPQGAYRMNKWQDDVLTARVGVALRYDIGDRVTLRGEARYGRVLNGSPGSAVTGQFVGVPAGGTMSFNGSKIGRNNVNIDVGAEVYLDSAKRVSAYAAYTFDYANRFRNHGGRAGISFNW